MNWKSTCNPSIVLIIQQPYIVCPIFKILLYFLKKEAYKHKRRFSWIMKIFTKGVMYCIRVSWSVGYKTFYILFCLDKNISVHICIWFAFQYFLLKCLKKNTRSVINESNWKWENKMSISSELVLYGFIQKPIL